MTSRIIVDREHARARGLTLEPARLAPLAAWAADEEAAGRLDFLRIVEDAGVAEAVHGWAASAPAATDVLIAGIGGSALTARIVEALRPSRAVGPTLHVLDTVDPAPVQELLGTLDPASCLLVGISKSGGTLETTAIFSVFEAWMQEALTEAAAERIVVICGEEANAFRTYAEARGYPTFAVPTGVGGRYSGLTPVGLLPAALVGVDPQALLLGAREARVACLTPDPAANPALALAELHVAAQEAGRHATVLFPYGERLAPLGPWWAQLVGESLGKPGPEGPLGVTPVAARGPADQHSLLQLLIEGPDDKFTVFVDAASQDAGPVVPAGLGDGVGHALGTILAAEREATTYALETSGRAWARVRLLEADARAVGAFLVTYEMAVVYWGRLIGVDPFGQPGVQLGKTAGLARLSGEPADLADEVRRYGDASA